MSAVREASPAVQAATRQQMRAAQHDVSAWVSANAGAGKTRVLVDRVIRLMLSGTEPGKILCLTYTNAAAAEMSNRLFARLAEWAVMADDALAEQISRLPGLGPEVSAKQLRDARNLFARALETPGGLKIQTIHAFCERLLHRFPLEADVPAGFNILDERRSRELMEDAISHVLAEAGRPEAALHSAFCHVAALLDEGSLAELVAALAGARMVRAVLHASDAIDSHLGRLAELWQVPPGLGPDEIIEHVAGANTFPAADYRQAMDALAGGAKTDQNNADIIRQALAPEASAETRFHLLSNYYLIQKGDRRGRLMTKKPAEAHPHILAFLESEQARYVAAQKLHLLAANRSLLNLAMAAIDRFEAAKRAHALLDYDDLIARTAALLSRSQDAQWVLYKLDGGIDHVLIDEAQDTSPEQWKIISYLTAEFFAGAGARRENRTVFAVGDEKQSIYSFQGADPKQFGAMQAHFAERAGQDGWRDVPLEVSFRSASAVLEAVDLVFAREPAAHGLSWQDGHIHHVPSRRAAGRVDIWPTEKHVEGDDEVPFPAPVDHVPQSSPDIRLADRIARQIGNWLREGAMLEARGRPVRAGDILILVRRRGSFADAMVRALKRQGLPVAGADRMKLGEQLAVQDLMALGAFVLQPDDDLSLACVLKSPLIGLEEEALMALAAHRRASLWQALLTACGAEDAEPLLVQAKERLEAWRAKAGTLRPFEFYAGLLDGEGLRREMIARLGTEAEDPLNEFLAQALNFEQDHLPSLQGFLAWMQSGETEIKRDMEHGKDEVRVMTVHGAKGLEAEIVFLPDTCRAPGGRQSPKLFALPEADTALPVWPVRSNLSYLALNDAREADQAAQQEEYHRLLYVAMTRAKDELYICGYETKTGRQPDCWYDLALAALEPHCDVVGARPDGEAVLRLRSGGQGAGAPEMQETESPADDKAEAVAPGWLFAPPAAEARPADTLAPSHAQPLPGLAPFARGGVNRFRRGNLVHRLLELLPEISPGERRARAEQFLARPDSRMDAAGAEALIGEVMRILEEPRYAPWFGPGSRAEAPFAALAPAEDAPEGGQAVYGQIDRIAILEKEIRILDYKTSRPVPATLDDIPEIYLRQMAAYRSGIKRIYPDKAIYCALLWTDGPVLSELPDALLDRFD